METSRDITPFAGGIPALIVTPEQRELIKRTVAKGTTDDELDLFIYYCKTRGVHPLDKMIYCIVRGKDKNRSCTFQPAIDYLRSEAGNSGLYGGQDEPEYGPFIELEYTDTEWVKGKPIDHEKKMQVPSWAKVKVYRKDVERPFVGVAQWTEYYPGQKMGFKWRTMPTLMLAKCAEALALRKAFPKKFAGMYIAEEMDQADVIDVTNTELGATYTDTVTSTDTPEPEQKGVTGHRAPSKLTAQESLLKELGEYCLGDEPLMAKTLKDLTFFKTKEGEELWVDLTTVSTINDKWAGAALRKLRELPPRDELL